MEAMDHFLFELLMREDRLVNESHIVSVLVVVMEREDMRERKRGRRVM